MRTTTLTIAAIAVLTSIPSFGDATIQQKTQFHMSGAAGGLVNAFGGKATHEGLTTTTIIRGNKRASIIGSNEKLVDLDAEKVYDIDLERNTYRVTTFAELRKQFEESKERASKGSGGSEKSSKEPEYEVEFSVKNTGEKQTVNGFAAHEVVATITVHEKGKTLEKGGGGVFTADLWIGPKIREMSELSSFERRYYEKLYGSALSGADAQQMAALLASNPSFGKAMKAFSDKQSSFDGTPVRTILTFESVRGTEQKADDDNSGPATSPGAALGGFLRRAAQRHQDANNAEEGRSKVFDSTTELLKASASATASDVSLPAGAKER